jgi:hypothetical protein
MVTCQLRRARMPRRCECHWFHVFGCDSNPLANASRSAVPAQWRRDEKSIIVATLNTLRLCLSRSRRMPRRRTTYELPTLIRHALAAKAKTERICMPCKQSDRAPSSFKKRGVVRRRRRTAQFMCNTWRMSSDTGLDGASSGQNGGLSCGGRCIHVLRKREGNRLVWTSPVRGLANRPSDPVLV